MGSEPVISIRCSPTGAVVDVLRDELGMRSRFPSGKLLTSIVEPGSLGEASRLLDEIGESGLAVDINLRVGLGSEVVSLVFLGYQTDRGINLIGARQALSREDLVRALTGPAERGFRLQQAPRLNTESNAGLTHRAVLALTAHDLRNHLNGILAAIQYLLADAAGLLETEHITLLQSIESSGRSMYKLMDDILEASTIESEGLKLDLKPTDILALINKKLSMSRIYADRKQVHLELVSTESVPLVLADPARINWVIDTLLSSHVDLSNRGGKVAISVAARDKLVMISVRADHTGLAGEDFGRLFDRQRHGIKGIKAGIVLAFQIMKRIVEEHGGTIQVAGNADTGLTITLALLISEQSPVRVKTHPG